MPVSAWIVGIVVGALVAAIAGGLDEVPRKDFNFARAIICGSLTFGACYLVGLYSQAI